MICDLMFRMNIVFCVSYELFSGFLSEAINQERYLKMNVDLLSNMTQMLLETLYDAIFDLVIVVSLVNYCNLNNAI